MDVYEAVTKRRSIRRFKAIPVPYEALEKCADAGRVAPSASNRQLLEYVIVDDEQLLPRVLDNIGLWPRRFEPERGKPPHAPRAYIVILISSVLEAELGATRRVVLYDVGIATENMVLVAQEQGVSSCVIATFAEARLKEILHIPDEYEIAMVLALGYADEVSVPEVFTGSVQWRVDSQGVVHVPKRKLEDITHRNQFP